MNNISNLINKILDFLLGPEAITGEPGFDPSQEGLKSRAKRKTLLIIALLAGIPALCGFAGWGTFNAVAAANATHTPTVTASPTLPGPQVSTEISTDVAYLFGPTNTELPNALTAMAQLPTSTPSPTSLTVGGILTSIAVSPTPCTGDHFLTQLVCDDLAMTATLEAVGVGTVVNVSGVDPKVTIVYVVPTNTFAPIIITATPTATDKVVRETVIVERIITATPAPTQTPWFFITQPPVVTVVWTQLVPVTVEVTVVVTATPTLTLTPSETPTPTETPTP